MAVDSISISIDLVCFNTALSRIYIHTKKVAARDHHHYLPFIRHLGLTLVGCTVIPAWGQNRRLSGIKIPPF